MSQGLGHVWPSAVKETNFVQICEIPEARIPFLTPNIPFETQFPKIFSRVSHSIDDKKEKGWVIHPEKWLAEKKQMVDHTTCEEDAPFEILSSPNLCD